MKIQLETIKADRLDWRTLFSHTDDLQAEDAKAMDDYFQKFIQFTDWEKQDCVGAAFVSAAYSDHFSMALLTVKADAASAAILHAPITTMSALSNHCDLSCSITLPN